MAESMPDSVEREMTVMQEGRRGRRKHCNKADDTVLHEKKQNIKLPL